jgi:hypothetical protein
MAAVIRPQHRKIPSSDAQIRPLPVFQPAEIGEDESNPVGIGPKWE